MSLLASLAVLKIIDAFSAGSSAKKQATAQAEFDTRRAEETATVLEDQAFSRRRLAKADEEDFRKRASRTFAERRAAGGASGTQLDTGSQLLAAGDFQSEVALQALRIRSGGRLEAERLEQQAGLTRRQGAEQAELTLASGESAQKRGLFRAGASLLTGLKEFNT